MKKEKHKLLFRILDVQSSFCLSDMSALLVILFICLF